MTRKEKKALCDAIFEVQNAAYWYNKIVMSLPADIRAAYTFAVPTAQKHAADAEFMPKAILEGGKS